MTKYRVRDDTFDTLEEIADKFGVNLEWVQRAFREGKQDSLGLPRGVRAVAVTIDDIEYATISGASNETGIDTTTIRKYLREGRADELNDWNHGREWFEVGDKRYRTIGEVVAATGWSNNTVRRHKRLGTLKDLQPKK